jgi:hypothetical protein
MTYEYMSICSYVNVIAHPELRACRSGEVQARAVHDEKRARIG